MTPSSNTFKFDSYSGDEIKIFIGNSNSELGILGDFVNLYYDVIIVNKRTGSEQFSRNTFFVEVSDHIFEVKRETFERPVWVTGEQYHYEEGERWSLTLHLENSAFVNMELEPGFAKSLIKNIIEEAKDDDTLKIQNATTVIMQFDFSHRDIEFRAKKKVIRRI